MKKTILTLLILVFAAGNIAFAQGNASSYYRKIASEQRKIRTKQVNFYKTSMQFTDETRLNKSRDMVLTQLDATKKVVNKIPAYKGDSAMRNDYDRILDIYIEAYSSVYDTVQLLRKSMSTSEDALIAYQNSFYRMEDYIDDAENKWQMNEDYFTGAYNVNAMDDPTRVQLNTLRSLALYVQDIRSSYASVSFMVLKMQDLAKKKQFDNMEDHRQELALKAEQAMVAISKIGDYIDEEDRDDDFLNSAALYYLSYVRDGADEDFAEALTALDEARYDESDKAVERSQWKIEKILEDFIETELDLNDRTEKFVNAYLKD
jgi:hypothetical protein